MKLSLKILISAFAIALAGDALGDDLRDYLPEENAISGWPMVETILCRTERDLFDYMNGGAELYFGFNFRRLAIRKFSGPDNIELVTELYYFKNNDDAYGIFSMLPVDEKLDLGDGGSYSEGLLRFWAGQFYCRIFLTGDYDRHPGIMHKTGAIIASGLNAAGDIPKIVNIMPARDRKLEGLHYFHDNVALGNLYYLHSRNALQLNNTTNVVMGEYYNINAESAELFLIEYPDKANAAQAFANAVTELFNITDEIKIKGKFEGSASNYKKCMAENIDSYIIIGFSELHLEYLRDRYDDLKANIEGCIESGE